MEPLGPEVRRELARHGPAGRMADVVAAWPDAVGEGIARNAWPARFTRDGTLVVHAHGAAWAFELTQRAAEIHARLGRSLVPRGLRFLDGPVPDRSTPPAVSEPRTAVRAATLDEAREAASWAAEIEDPKLRELVARAARASLARRTP